MKDKLNRLFLYGAMGLIAGFLLQDVCPLNKKVWSPTFVLVTCGLAAMLQSVLIYFIDMKAVGYRGDEEISEDLDFCHIWCKSVVLLCT